MTPTPAMTADDAQLELRRRLRAYFLKVVGLIIASLFLLPLVAGGVAKAAGAQNASAIAAAVGGLSMLGTVAYAWYLVFTTWRCPACDANIYWLVSWNMSAFAGMASKSCPKCNVVLFGPRAGRRVFLLVAIAVVLGALGALMAVGASAQRSRQRQHDVTQPAPLPPG